MFHFQENSLPERSPCLQQFKMRRRNSRRTNGKLLQIRSIQRERDRREASGSLEKSGPIIEEIDGVKFYRTTVPIVCQTVASTYYPRENPRKYLKIKEQPTTIVVPQERHRLRIKKRGKRLFDKHSPDVLLNTDIFSAEENEERKMKLLERLIGNDKENALTRAEEEIIHERAELYSMSIKPDINYLVLPENDFSHKDDPAYLASVSGQQLAYPLPKKRKSRNILTDSCYLSYHTPDDPYDNSQSLPCGTKLYRPPDKLVELVADAVLYSPDGLLQVSQIYTILMNRYPYFRYMDRTAAASWRSSVRHALFQKWFKKLKFTTPEISSKGCFWCINSGEDEMNDEIQKTEDKLEDYDLDPNTHDNVVALLHEEDRRGSETMNADNIKVPVYHFTPGEDNSLISDPILTPCYSIPSDSYYYERQDKAIPTNKNAILPVSMLNSRCSSPCSDSSNSSSLVISPLMHSIRPDILGIDPQSDLVNSGVDWAPDLPFDFTNFSHQNDDVFSSDTGSYDLSISPDLSNRSSSPELCDLWPSYPDCKEDIVGSTEDITMDFSSNDLTQINHILPDDNQWGLITIDQLPSSIFDKEVMSANYLKNTP